MVDLATEDDLTKQTLAKFLGKELVFDEEASKKLDVSLLLVLNTNAIMNTSAQIVEGAIPLQNPTGLAVGGVITAQRGDLCGAYLVHQVNSNYEVNQELVPAVTENHASLLFESPKILLALEKVN